MPPNLQGLNIVHPVQAHQDSHDLLAGQSYPDLSAQLDLWTNLAFECDETPLAPKPDDNKYRKKSTAEEEEEDGLITSHGSSTGEAAIHDGHVNVVTPTNLGSNLPHPPPPVFDLNAFLAGFGIDPYSAPPVLHNQAPHPSTGISPSLAQLIALHTTPGQPSFPAPANPAAHDNAPPAKRARSRKASISTADSPDEHSYREETPSAQGQTISAAEDKRRRNTAASARFRLKKKEREAALEGRAKELETRVNELERECEGLRRENGWLKGLVVGVTGAAQAPVPAAGTKRGRDEEGA
ncbi:hypothetical protein D9615_004744 [Tricholomella constricta]|uniref:BZIP domain-containing protein n=1 Tax=Tricholomella constricta TaxID=117010 RepID=A0A8H5M4K6_9AGAR|nr:hypothetical protein D9615_004744 [Tricholomella constricta]